MQRALAGAIGKFGVEAVAEAFAERIMRIPRREYEIEVDRGIDELLGNPLQDAVERYGTPGFAPKFLSERCIGVLGMRGYRIVKDEHGDPVKVGTLIMGEIPQGIADRRREAAAEESREKVRDIQESFQVAADRVIQESRASGVTPLREEELIHANATESEGYIGQSRTAGVRFEHE